MNSKTNSPSTARTAKSAGLMNERLAKKCAVEKRLFELLAFSAALTARNSRRVRHCLRRLDQRRGASISAAAACPRSPSARRRWREPACATSSSMPEKQTVRYLRDGLEINLGSIGKGYALDRAAEMLRNRLGNRFRPAARRRPAACWRIGAPPGQSAGWAVSLKHPWDANRSIGVVYLRNRALGTSAATYQFFEYNGRKLGHLLDPRKGWPAEGVQQVSVVAPTAAEADALSTAFFVMGLDETRLYCQSTPPCRRRDRSR